MRVLVTGRDGQVGRELVRALKGVADVEATGRSELDLADPRSLVRALHERSPDLVINAAAYTAVDRAESEPGGALAVNATGPRALAEEAARLGIPVVHYSTDYVFDGEGGAPYDETDPTAPRNVYGRTKLIGERAVLSSGAPCLVLRVGWVYGGRRRNFVTTMLELFATRDRVSVVEDERGGPTWSRTIATATRAALEAVGGTWTRMTRAGLAEGLRERGGLFHLAPPDHAGRHELAREIHAIAARGGAFHVRPCEIEAIRQVDWSAPAARPRDTRLTAERLATSLGVSLPPWREALAECLAETASRRADLVPADPPAALLRGR